MKKTLAMAMAALILGLSGVVYAETTVAAASNTTVGAGSGSTKTPKIRKRARRQGARVLQGVKSGELTKDEVKDLRESKKAIRDKVKDAKSDGKVTLEERKDIHKDLNDRSKDIYEKKHNDVKRPKAQ